MAQFKAISADSHVQQPTTFYLERVPAPYRDKTPRVVEQSDGTYLIADGMKPRRLDVAASRLTDEDREREFREEPSGGTDIERRIAGQERDGVVAEVIYPNNLGAVLDNATYLGWHYEAKTLSLNGKTARPSA